ncbi:MAG: glutathione S-transferase C-terminal domain-containing protein [Hoeflea sp.]|uniref:glutathione S-transferase C-terminal domain-containing protein n=1 Tax=Hoeflea sp. TaxID=1940281 RepID=UPI003EF9F71B
MPNWSSFITSDKNGFESGRHVLVASLSCPWSHATLVARAILGLEEIVPLHIAGGARIEGYALLHEGPLNSRQGSSSRDPVYRHVHQLYTAANPHYSGKVTVPVLWDRFSQRLALADSSDILRWLDNQPGQPSSRLHPETPQTRMTSMLELLKSDLMEPIYRAGLAKEQDEYDQAVMTVFATLAALETRLRTQRFLLGSTLSVCDIRLFCILVRFDTIYGPFFRCTRKRLCDHTALWAYARDIMSMPGVRETVNMRIIQEGYYLNDGDTNPHGIVAEAPELDWAPDGSRDHLSPYSSAGVHRMTAPSAEHHVVLGSAHV